MNTNTLKSWKTWIKLKYLNAYIIYQNKAPKIFKKKKNLKCIKLWSVKWKMFLKALPPPLKSQADSLQNCIKLSMKTLCNVFHKAESELIHQTNWSYEASVERDRAERERGRERESQREREREGDTERDRDRDRETERERTKFSILEMKFRNTLKCGARGTLLHCWWRYNHPGNQSCIFSENLELL